MTESMNYWIKNLHLEPHPEGGYFVETTRSNESLDLPQGSRPLFTSIIFLLTTDNPSHFHRLSSDETWFYHAGSPLTVHCIFPDGHYAAIKIGPNLTNGECLSYTVPKGTIFGSSVSDSFSVVSCVVTPGFDYNDFELFTQSTLINKYPEHTSVIKQLAYEEILKQ